MLRNASWSADPLSVPLGFRFQLSFVMKPSLLKKIIIIIKTHYRCWLIQQLEFSPGTENLTKAANLQINLKVEYLNHSVVSLDLVQWTSHCLLLFVSSGFSSRTEIFPMKLSSFTLFAEEKHLHSMMMPLRCVQWRAEGVVFVILHDGRNIFIFVWRTVVIFVHYTSSNNNHNQFYLQGPLYLKLRLMKH